MNTSLPTTATGTVGTAVTLTLPAVPGCHAIFWVEITMYATAAKTGIATPILVTSTNLGGLAFTFPSAAAIGTSDRRFIEAEVPMKSQIPNTATTIVCPATPSVIWRVTVLSQNTN